MAGKRRAYSEEFKVEAVRLVNEGGLSLAQVSRDLGISPTLLGRWRKLFPAGAAREARLDSEELRRLRRELIRVREERDILKKAAAYFAKESR